MLREVRFQKKPAFILNLEKKGGTNYKVYEKDHLTILAGIEPVGPKKSMVMHITVNSKMRYRASVKELTEIAKELLPKESNFKIKKSFFMKTVSHIYEVTGK